MKKIRKQQKLLLFTLIGLALLTIIFAVFVIVYINNALISGLLAILMITSFAFLIIFKSKYDYIRHLYLYERLLSESEKPIVYKEKINLGTIKLFLQKNNYKIHVQTDSYIMVYKIENIFSGKNKDRTLFASLILLDDTINFTDELTNNCFEQLEKKLSSKEKYLQRIFFRFQFIPNDNKEKYADANKIFFITTNRENIVLMNILIQEDSNSIYYLHSKNFAPNKYYSFATKLLNSIK